MTLKSNCKWFGEQLINAGQQMLLKAFPNTAGLYGVGLLDTLSYPCESRNSLM